MDFLLVEDNELAAAAIKMNLEKNGHRVAVAMTGKHALHLSLNRYDAILLDVCLPDMDGFEVARVIRSHEAERNLILGISSMGKHIKEACLRAGFDAVYDKPISESDVLKIIRGI